MLLNGTTMYANAATNAVFDQTTTSFGISLFLNVAALPGTKGYIVSKRNDASTNPGFDVYINSAGNVVAEICDTTNNLGGNTSVKALSINTWYHILIYWNRGDKLYCYINGVLDSSTGINSNTCTNTQTFAVGRHSNSSASFLNATFDQLAVWNSSGAFNTAGPVRQVFGDCHSGMIAMSTSTASGFTVNLTYQRSAENLLWKNIAVTPPGAVSTVLISGGASSDASWGQIVTASIATGAVTNAKLASALTVYAQTSSGSNATTTSTSPTDEGSTNTITAAGSKTGLMTTFQNYIGNNTASDAVAMLITDGSNVVKASVQNSDSSVSIGTDVLPASMHAAEAAPAAGSLTRKVRFSAITGGTATSGVSSTVSRNLSTMEIL